MYQTPTEGCRYCILKRCVVAFEMINSVSFGHLWLVTIDCCRIVQTFHWMYPEVKQLTTNNTRLQLFVVYILH